MIESILPSAVVAVDTFADPAGATLFREEEMLVSRAVQKRRTEFTTGRWCARQAMQRLGKTPAPILTGARGEPQWPAGLIGSITHCAGYRAAVVAESGRVSTVGIDAEPDEPLNNGILEAVSLPEERPRIETLGRDHRGVNWDRLLFSAKESVYKAWFPLTGRWLDFQDADIVINPLDGTFAAVLRVAGPRLHGRPLTGFSGRWLAQNGLVVTAITILDPAEPAQAATAAAHLTNPR